MEWNESGFHIFDSYKEYSGKDDEFTNFHLMYKQFCSEKDLRHCYSVRNIMLDILYLNDMSCFLTGEHQFIEAVALGHDLLEDTDFRESEYWNRLSKEMQACLILISKGQEESYNHYIQSIRCLYDDKASLSECVYIVKLADIIDHLMRYKTLSDSLKKRYLKALDIMLQEEN